MYRSFKCGIGYYLQFFSIFPLRRSSPPPSCRVLSAVTSLPVSLRFRTLSVLTASLLYSLLPSVFFSFSAPSKFSTTDADVALLIECRTREQGSSRFAIAVASRRPRSCSQPTGNNRKGNACATVLASFCDYI